MYKIIDLIGTLTNLGLIKWRGYASNAFCTQIGTTELNVFEGTRTNKDTQQRAWVFWVRDDDIEKEFVDFEKNETPSIYGLLNTVKNSALKPRIYARTENEKLLSKILKEFAKEFVSQK